MIENFFHPNHPLRCIVSGPSLSGKSVFLTNLFFIEIIKFIIHEYDKIYIYSPSFYQDFYQKIFKCFTNYIPINIIPNNLNEKVFDVVIDEIVHNKNFEKSSTEIETYESIEELGFPQEYDVGGLIILDDLYEKELNDPRVHAMFKRHRQKFLSNFIISQE